MPPSDTQETLFLAAFLRAQRAFKDPRKDSTNPHFKSKFADLGSVLDAIREPLWDNGITLRQEIRDNAVHTVLQHTGGGFVSSDCPIVCAKQNDPQAMGSAITYARRYSLMALCCLAPDDDDGEQAVQRTPTPTRTAPAPKTEPFSCVEEAEAALKVVNDKQAMVAWTARVAASGFIRSDRDRAIELYEARKKELNQ